MSSLADRVRCLAADHGADRDWRCQQRHFVGTASAWEIATKVRIGKLPGAVSIAADLAAAVKACVFVPLPIAFAPRLDPFDRMPVVQAMADGLILVERTAVQRVWHHAAVVDPTTRASGERPSRHPMAPPARRPSLCHGALAGIALLGNGLLMALPELLIGLTYFLHLGLKASA